MASSGAEVRGALRHENAKAGTGVVEVKPALAGVKMQRLAPGLLRSLGMTMQCTPPWVVWSFRWPEPVLTPGVVEVKGALPRCNTGWVRGCGSSRAGIASRMLEKAQLPLENLLVSQTHTSRGSLRVSVW